MAKTTKRGATKRAEKIAKAHVTPLPSLEVKGRTPMPRGPGYKRPARGVARYPWAIGLTIVIIGLIIFTLYFYRLGPFAKPKPTAVVVKPTPILNLTLPNPSPCLKVVNQLTDKSPTPSPAEFKKIIHTYPHSPTLSIDTTKFYCVGLNTNRGLIVLAVGPHYASDPVNNFVFLALAPFSSPFIFPRVLLTSPVSHII